MAGFGDVLDSNSDRDCLPTAPVGQAQEPKLVPSRFRLPGGEKLDQGQRQMIIKYMIYIKKYNK